MDCFVVFFVDYEIFLRIYKEEFYKIFWEYVIEKMISYFKILVEVEEEFYNKYNIFKMVFVFLDIIDKLKVVNLVYFNLVNFIW